MGRIKLIYYNWFIINFSDDRFLFLFIMIDVVKILDNCNLSERITRATNSTIILYFCGTSISRPNFLAIFLNTDMLYTWIFDRERLWNTIIFIYFNLLVFMVDFLSYKIIILIFIVKFIIINLWILLVNNSLYIINFILNFTLMCGRFVK